MVAVLSTDEYQAWFDGLSQPDAASVLQSAKVLAIMGVTMGAPLSSSLEGTDFAFRELRPKQGRSPLRRTEYLALRGSTT